MTVSELLHRELVDPAVILARKERMETIEDALELHPAWKDAGEILRRHAALRFAFCAWRWHDHMGWRDALRNRRFGRAAQHDGPLLGEGE